jgi:hypothetical protein
MRGSSATIAAKIEESLRETQRLRQRIESNPPAVIPTIFQLPSIDLDHHPVIVATSPVDGKPLAGEQRFQRLDLSQQVTAHLGSDRDSTGETGASGTVPAGQPPVTSDFSYMILIDAKQPQGALHTALSRCGHSWPVSRVVGSLGTIDNGVTRKFFDGENHIVEFRFAVITTITGVGSVIWARQFICFNFKMANAGDAGGSPGGFEFLRR